MRAWLIIIPRWLNCSHVCVSFVTLRLTQSFIFFLCVYCYIAEMYTCGDGFRKCDTFPRHPTLRVTRTNSWDVCQFIPVFFFCHQTCAPLSPQTGRRKKELAMGNPVVPMFAVPNQAEGHSMVAVNLSLSLCVCFSWPVDSQYTP